MHRMIALVLTLAFTITSAAVAAPGKKAASKTSTITGTIVGYQEHGKHKNLVISVANDTGKPQEQSVKLDDSTKITLDGNTVAASALRAGEKVIVTIVKKVATEVTATSN
jgi:hypothetical protein